MNYFGLASADNPNGTLAPQDTDADSVVTSDEWYLPVPWAQQLFTYVPSVAGFLAGLVLAQKFASNNATHVKASEILVASGLSFAASFAVVFMVQSFQTYENVPPEGP